jgi:hypothetical protein
MARFRGRTQRGSLEELFRRPETSAMERLHAEGFSAEMIEAFFRPFFGGVLLDRSLCVCSRAAARPRRCSRRSGRSVREARPVV